MGGTTYSAKLDGRRKGRVWGTRRRENLTSGGTLPCHRLPAQDQSGSDVSPRSTPLVDGNFLQHSRDSRNVWRVSLCDNRTVRHPVEMDVPTRQSHVAAVVPPNERTFASGLTSLARNVFWAVGSLGRMLTSTETGFLMLLLAPWAHYRHMWRDQVPCCQPALRMGTTRCEWWRQHTYLASQAG